MTKAFLDTTILADALLKIGPMQKRARTSLANFDELLVPGYAVKEFKRGPLRGYVWLHNKVVSTGRWGDAIAAICTIWQQHNLANTAIRAVSDFTSSMATQRVRAGEIGRNSIEYHAIEAKEARIWLKTKIIKAWRDQSREPFMHVKPLECYAMIAPSERADGMIDNQPLSCTLVNCCLKRQFDADPISARKLEQACADHAAKPEMAKRRTVLRQIRRKPNSELTNNQCLTLGDAVFALQCPPDAVVLTTNISDHGPLTAALGKTAVTPSGT